jgi:hypothetical protein
MKGVRMRCFGIAIVTIGFALTVGASADRPLHYAVLVNDTTRTAEGWSQVVDSLVARYDAQVFTYQGWEVGEVREAMAAYHPTHVCLVGHPRDVPGWIVERTNQVVRELDDDPYGDAILGVVTGLTAEHALKLATGPESMVVTGALLKTAAGWLDWVHEGRYYSETVYHSMWIKYPDGTVDTTMDGPTDCTDSLVSHLNEGWVDLMVTSGHASQKDWQLHYPDPDSEGFFRAENGRLYGDPFQGDTLWIDSPNDKIYWAPGNCLIGQIPWGYEDCMVIGWLASGSARQYSGYTRVTWYGYMGWGISEYLLHLQGQWSYAEAVYLNNQALLYDLIRGTPGTDSAGLEYDKDYYAFYGDPAFDARLEPCRLPLYDQELVVIPGEAGGDTFRFTITMNEEGRPWHGGGRPCFVFLPYRIVDPTIVWTDAHEVVITDDFVLMDIWEEGDPSLGEGEQRTVEFIASAAGLAEVPDGGGAPADVDMRIFPNPFRNTTTVTFRSPVGSGQWVLLSVYDAAGRRVRRLEDGKGAGAVQVVVWKGDDDRGEMVAGGVYFLRMEVEGQDPACRKVVLVR